MANLGLQLYSIKEEAQRDLLGTLAKVAEIGYEGVEFAGYYGAEARDVRRVLEQEGLRAAGVHIPYHLIDEQLERQLEYAGIIGCEAILCPMVPKAISSEERSFHEAAERFNRYGRKCRENGIRFLYHIHGYEFTDFGAGRTGMDILLGETEPELVAFEFDTFWVEFAGLDSVEYYNRIGSRCPYMHYKDRSRTGELRDTEVGEGSLDIAKLAAAGLRAGADWFIVEQEQFDRPQLESVSISLRNLRRILER
ncbi:sugar phosphate isomerase/epimerase family protein [Paenibacillus koleovorans]|uniref:sugar phosphate isomerase/epimerase family protein n=1 Tax=Paenibacillus koleovorans TaxID=121608 RepID=UPI000FDA41EE|nr:sugar phosphate isomerase/epimerase [Paenibacillus koleovorans]